MLNCIAKEDAKVGTAGARRYPGLICWNDAHQVVAKNWNDKTSSCLHGTKSFYLKEETECTIKYLRT